MTRADAVLQHYARFFRTAPVVVHDSADGLPKAFRVLRFDPGVYGTVGLSEALGTLELHLLAPANAPAASLAGLLTSIARFHARRELLGVDHTVSFGRPWLPGSACDHGLVTLPEQEGLEVMRGDPEVRFLRLLPITRAEVDFKIREGIDALEDRFEKSGLDYRDPLRPSVVP